VNDVGDSDQVPFDTVNTWETLFVPVTTGTTEFTGRPVTAADDADQRLSDPVAFVAVTFTDTNLPASAATWVYVFAVASVINEHAAG
jgi:hypothetical protein